MMIANEDNFRLLLEGAISGNENDMETILNLYKPLIINQSIIHGKFDEDLNQEILYHLIKNISKFSIDY